jgi:hypothetical protein
MRAFIYLDVVLFMFIVPLVTHPWSGQDSLATASLHRMAKIYHNVSDIISLSLSLSLSLIANIKWLQQQWENISYYV